MMDFEDLIEAKDKAVAEAEECRVKYVQVQADMEAAHDAHEAAIAIREEAHKAIHDVLAEYGEHYGIDQATGTVTVYKPIDEPPGWCAVHPIPGRTKTAETKKHK